MCSYMLKVLLHVIAHPQYCTLESTRWTSLSTAFSTVVALWSRLFMNLWLRLLMDLYGFVLEGKSSNK